MSKPNSDAKDAGFGSAIYIAYEDGISNRARRALRGPSPRERYRQAQEAQRRSGVRYRIARKVSNQLDFKPQSELWIPSVQSGSAERKSLGSFAMTLFDTNQQPLHSADEFTEEELRDKFARRYPALFRKSPPIEVTGTDVFGDEKGVSPFIGLTLAPGFAFDEFAEVREIVAPELILDDRHQKDHRPHVSLGKVFARESVEETRDRAEEIRKLLHPVLPVYVQFEAAVISVENRNVLV